MFGAIIMTFRARKRVRGKIYICTCCLRLFSDPCFCLFIIFFLLFDWKCLPECTLYHACIMLFALFWLPSHLIWSFGNKKVVEHLSMFYFNPRKNCLMIGIDELSMLNSIAPQQNNRVKSRDDSRWSVNHLLLLLLLVRQVWKVQHDSCSVVAIIDDGDGGDWPSNSQQTF